MSKEAMMGTPEKQTAAVKPRKPLPLILVKRAAILFLLINAISLFLWIVGSYTSFLDETQTALLGALRFASLLLIFDAVVGEAATLAYAVAARRSLRLAALLGYAACALTGAAGLLLSNALLILEKGLS
jgi:hypothetical protein